MTPVGPRGVSQLATVTRIAAVGGFLFAASAASASENHVSGEAFGVLVDIKTMDAGITVGPSPKVALAPGGGMDREEILAVEVPGTILSDTLTVMTSGSINSESATAQSSASVEYLDILDGIVTADLVVAMCNGTGDGVVASSNTDGSALVGLTVNGVVMEDVVPPPNTVIGVPGVGTVILNEQTGSGDGSRSSGVTVNMIHVKLDDTLDTGDIIVSSAHCGVDFVPEPKEPTGFMTGGGRLGQGRDIATFGLNAGPRGGDLKGRIQYIDHGQGLKVHGTSVDWFEVSPDGNCASFSGDARVNGEDGFRYEVTIACDDGEPGVGVDSLAISVDGATLAYRRDGVLTGGNLQMH